MSGTFAEVHRKRSRMGIALMIAGTAILVLGVFYFFAWLYTYEGILDAAANGWSIDDRVVTSVQQGSIAIAAFAFGIPIFLLGLAQVWLAGRRNAMIEGAMIERLLAGSDHRRSEQVPAQ